MQRNKILYSAFNPNVCPHKAVQQMVLIKTKAPEEQRPGVDQQDPQTPNIKEEEEELWTSLDVDQHTVKNETDDTEFGFTALPLKREDDEEKPLFSQLHQHSAEDGDLPTSSSADQKKAATDGEDCGGAEIFGVMKRTAAKNEVDFSYLKKKEQQNKILNAVLNPKDELHRLDVPQMVLIKEEAPEEQRPGVDLQDPETLNIKEENEEPWTSLEGEQLYVKEETDDPRISFTAVLLKSEDDEEKPLLLQLYQHQVEDEGVPASSSADKMNAATCGGAETTRNPDLDTYEDVSSSSETEVSEEEEDVKYTDYQLKDFSDFGSEPEDCDKDWKASRTPESDVNTVNKSCSLFDCGKQFPHEQPVQRHMTCLSSMSSSFLVKKKCFRMKKTGGSSKVILLSQKSFSCDVCEQRFEKKSNLNRHMMIHTGQKPFACDVCEQRFGQKSALNRHMRVHSGQKPFACEVCGQRFGDKSNLNSHIRIHTGQKPFACDVCGQRFGDKSNLNSHKRDHSGQKPWVCDVCRQRFRFKSTLNSHMMIHTGQKPFACDHCRQRFGQKSHLDTHMMIHTGQKPFACDVCGQTFRQKSTLGRHMKVHTDDKPFACDVCGQKFQLKSNLNTHMKIHTGQKAFACDVCGQRFRLKTALNTHMTIHTDDKPFACDVCEQRFGQKSHLNAHMRIHTGQKPFACEVCEQRFRQKSNLNAHMRIHTGQKPFACEVCEQRFTQKSNLNKHMRIHTRGEDCLIVNIKTAPKDTLEFTQNLN